MPSLGLWAVRQYSVDSFREAKAYQEEMLTERLI